MEGRSVTAPWESSSTGGRERHYNGPCCHEALSAAARQERSILKHDGVFVFEILDFQNPSSFCGQQAHSFLCPVSAAVGGQHPCLENTRTGEEAIPAKIGIIHVPSDNAWESYKGGGGGGGSHGAAVICIISSLFPLR